MTFEDYQLGAREFADYPSYEITTDNALYNVSPRVYFYPVTGLAAEAGEVVEKFAKCERDKQFIDGDDVKEISKELGDVLWFVAEIATRLNLSLSDVARENIAKLKSRKERNVIHGSGDNR